MPITEGESYKLEEIYYQLGAMSVTGSSDSDALSATAKHQSKEVITVVDQSGTMHFVNEAISAALGYGSQELSRQSIFTLVHPDDRASLRTALSDLGFCTCLPLTVRFRHSDGSWRRLEGVASNQQDIPAISGILLCLHDLTSSRKIESELRLQIEQLTAERDEARAAYLAKSRLLESISEEIRTPMNGVLGTTMLLEDTPLDARQRQMVSTIKRSGESLLALTSSVLDLSKACGRTNAN